MIESLIIARLQERVTGQQVTRYTKGAVDFAAAMQDGAKVTPVQYVLLGDVSDTANTFGTQIVRQRRSINFSVISIVSALRDVSGASGASALESVLSPTLAALLGWVPTPDCDPIEARGSRVLDFKGGQLWWQDRFITTYFIEAGIS